MSDQERGLQEGPPSPEEDENFGPEKDDPTAAAPYESPYPEHLEVDMRHEKRDLHDTPSDQEVAP